MHSIFTHNKHKKSKLLHTKNIFLSNTYKYFDLYLLIFKLPIIKLITSKIIVYPSLFMQPLERKHNIKNIPRNNKLR